MSIIELILNNRLTEAKEEIFKCLDTIANSKLDALKSVVNENSYEIVELDEATPNVIKVGRIQKIRRRIRRNKKGRIVVQKNVRRSAVKGYRISGNTVKRIPAVQRINKARKLKRYWKTKGKARLGRTLLKRKMSMRRRTSMGIK